MIFDAGVSCSCLCHKIDINNGDGIINDPICAFK